MLSCVTFMFYTTFNIFGDILYPIFRWFFQDKP